MVITIQGYQGDYFTASETAALKSLGFTKTDALLDTSQYCNYIGVYNDGNVIYEECTNEAVPRYLNYINEFIYRKEYLKV